MRWRRYHGDLLACVRGSSAKGYVIEVISRVTASVSPSRSYRRLLSAQAAADDLLRKFYSHRCTVELCGRWVEWPE